MSLFFVIAVFLLLGAAFIFGSQQVRSRRGRDFGEDEESRYEENHETTDDAEVLQVKKNISESAIIMGTMFFKVPDSTSGYFSRGGVMFL